MPITGPEEVDSHSVHYGNQTYGNQTYNTMPTLSVTHQYESHSAVPSGNDPMNPLATGPPALPTELQPTLPGMTQTYSANPIYADMIVSNYSLSSTDAELETLEAYRVSICYPIHLYDS